MYGCRQRFKILISQYNFLSKFCNREAFWIKRKYLCVLAIWISNELSHLIKATDVIIALFIYSQDIRECLSRPYFNRSLVSIQHADRICFTIVFCRFSKWKWGNMSQLLSMLLLFWVFAKLIDKSTIDKVVDADISCDTCRHQLFTV